MVAQFVDISGAQGTIDFHAYAAWSRAGDGISRVAMKATEGVGFVDPFFATNRAKAIEAGIDAIILYHFARPDLGNSPEAEADFMHSVVGSIRANDIIALDYEVDNLASSAVWAYRWLKRQESNYGKPPAIYSYPSFIASHLQYPPLASYPLWYASWEYTPDERPPAPAPWTSYEWLQYSDKASNIPGISGIVDADVYISSGETQMNGTLYGPGQGSDFDQWFVDQGNNVWRRKSNGAIIMGGNLGFYRTLSPDGRTLPFIGLPLESEQYHQEPDGYHWSSQQFERATIWYDPAHRKDSQPGAGSSYLAHVNPQPIPDAALQKQIADLEAKIAQAQKALS